VSGDGAVDAYNADLERLLVEVRGKDLVEVEERCREWATLRARHLRDVDIAVLARSMFDTRWALKHPLSAWGLAFKHRRTQPVRRTLRVLFRSGVAG
jgi:FAD/FMN-containing dehydrogenase